MPRERVYSLTLMALGSLSILATSFLLKKTLTPEEFGVYAIIFTSTTFVSSIGFIGSDQAFFRYAKFNNGVISTNQTTIIAITLLATLCFLATFSYTAAHTKSIGLAFLIILTSFLIHFTYTLIRTQNRKIASQISSNIWKIIFLILTLPPTCFFNSGATLNTYLSLLLISLASCLLISIKTLNARVLIDNSQQHEASAIPAFALSSLILAIMSFMDRVLVSELYGVAEIGEFFYYSTFLVMPFRFISGFIAADRSISYKKNSEPNLFIKDLKNGLIFSLLLASLMTAAIFILGKTINIGIEVNWLLFSLLTGGVIRIMYSFFSAKVSMSSPPGKIKSENIYYIITCAIATPAALLIMPLNSLIEIAWLINALWATRIAQYSIRIIKWQ